MDKTEAMLRRILLNQASIMIGLEEVAETRQMKGHLNRMVKETMDLLDSIK